MHFQTVIYFAYQQDLQKHKQVIENSHYFRPSCFSELKKKILDMNSKRNIPNIITYKLALHKLVKGYICLDSDNIESPEFQIPMSSVIFFEDRIFF